jgi:prepilin-type N-terminal cleavage/methylation domain-containing protein
VTGQPRKRKGFTLIEVMAVVALIGFVFFVALNFYTDLARASTRASDHTRDIRRASAILDRVARDIEGAMLLVRPPEMDPFAFPWIFLGETRLGGDASERLKFVTRNHNPMRTDAAETNLATVAYTVESRPDDSIALYRWTSPHLPESLDKSFPREDDEGSFLLAEGLQTFGFNFLGEDGELRREWDSSTLLESNSLPLAVEIQLTMMADETSDEEEPPIYQRRVLIPIRPLDLAALADPNDPIFGTGEGKDSEEGDDEDGKDGKGGKSGKGGKDSKGGRGSGGSGGDDDDGTGSQLTNADCFPTSVPDSASMWAKMCIGLAASAPNMAFTPADYRGMPEDCKPFVDPKCR